MKGLSRVLLALIAFALAQAASATPIPTGTYELGNHPDGGAADPLYGLRLDNLLGVPASGHHIYTFDFEAEVDSTVADMQMVWDGNELQISGTAYGGRDVGSTYDSEIQDWWEIDFTYTDFWNCGWDLCTLTGSGSITSLYGGFGSYHLTSESGSHSFAFRLRDGVHRGHDGINGWGWVNHCAEGDNPPYAGANCGVHQYASDWLFTATPVPEPSTLMLFGIGLLGLGFARRRIVAA